MTQKEKLEVGEMPTDENETPTTEDGLDAGKVRNPNGSIGKAKYRLSSGNVREDF